MIGSRRALAAPGFWARFMAGLRLLFRRDTPWRARLLGLAALVYLLSPVDLIPDWLVALGWLDDLTLATLLLSLAIRIAEQHRQRP